MDPQRVINVCEPNWEAHKSDCSGFVKAVCAALEVGTFTADDNADLIVDKLHAATDWRALAAGHGATAKSQADAGLLVIAGLKGADQVQPDPHGHAVVVVTGPLDSSHGKYPTAYWGRLGGVGGKAQSINFAWRGGDRHRVGYFRKKPVFWNADAASRADRPNSRRLTGKTVAWQQANRCAF